MMTHQHKNSLGKKAKILIQLMLGLQSVLIAVRWAKERSDFKIVNTRTLVLSIYRFLFTFKQKIEFHEFCNDCVQMNQMSFDTVQMLVTCTVLAV